MIYHNKSRLMKKKHHPNVVQFKFVEKQWIHYVWLRRQTREHEGAWHGGVVWGDRALPIGEVEGESESEVSHVLEVHILQIDRGGRRHAVQPDGEVSI